MKNTLVIVGIVLFIATVIIGSGGKIIPLVFNSMVNIVVYSVESSYSCVVGLI